MTPFHRTDGYREVSVFGEESMVVLFIAPQDGSPIVQTHFQARLAAKLGWWLLTYWVRDRLCGLRDWWKLRRAMKDLSEGGDPDPYEDTP